MFLFIDVSRMLFYGLLFGLAYFGELPWWVAPAWILWDNSVSLMFRIPFTKTKGPEAFNWENYKGQGQ